MRSYLLVFSYTKYHNELLSNINLREEFPNREIFKFDSVSNASRLHKVKLRLIILFYFFRFRVAVLLGNEVEILAPHPEHIIANYFFFSKKVKKVYLYEDGLLNYIDVKLSGGIKKRSLKRKALSPLLFYRYKVVEDHLSGCQQRVISRGYFQYPDEVYLSNKYNTIKKISLERVCAFGTDSEVALFIDQDIESVYGVEKGKGLREKLYSHLSQYKKVYVKFHHDYISSGFSVESLPDNFAILEKFYQDDIAENVVARIGAGVACSFTSTALINISTKHQNIKCFCCTSEWHEVKTRLGEEKISELFKRFNVLDVNIVR